MGKITPRGWPFGPLARESLHSGRMKGSPDLHVEPHAGYARDFLESAVGDSAKRLVAREVVRTLALNDEIPIPRTEDREGYYDDLHIDYWCSGYADAARLLGIAPDSPAIKYLDLGGCTGRVARHLVGTKNWDVSIAEVNPRYVAWLHRHLPKITATLIERVPPTPFETGSFDLISAYSVFTHIDREEEAWLAELRRLLRPGGVVYLTVCEEEAWAYTRANEWVWRAVSSNGSNRSFLRDLNGPMPRDKYVIRSGPEHCTVYRTQSHLERVWSRYFSDLRIVPMDHVYQAAVIGTI
jgi:SAM-dependent methyltransferase